MSKYTENFPKLETYDLETVFCQLKEVCGADPGGLISMQFKSRITTAKDIALLLFCTYKIMEANISLQKQFECLYNFVKDFYMNLDLQDEVNKKLENMYNSGELKELLGNFLDEEIDEINNNLTELSNRVDELSKITDISTDVEREVVDIRTPSYGFNYNTPYENAGDAVRGQASSIVDRIKTLNGAKSILYTLNGYIQTGNVLIGNIVDLTPVTSATTPTANYYQYAIVDVEDYDYVLLSGIGGGTPRLWAFLDNNNNLLYMSPSSNKAENNLIYIPKKAYKIVINIEKNSYKESFLIKSNVLFNNLFKLTERFPIYLNNCYITTNTSPVTISPSNSGDYKCMIINCKQDDVFTITGADGDKPRLWAFIDENGNILYKNEYSSTYEKNKKIIAPENAYYLICNFNISTFTNEETKQEFVYESYIHKDSELISRDLFNIFNFINNGYNNYQIFKCAKTWFDNNEKLTYDNAYNPNSFNRVDKVNFFVTEPESDQCPIDCMSFVQMCLRGVGFNQSIFGDKTNRSLYPSVPIDWLSDDLCRYITIRSDGYIMSYPDTIDWERVTTNQFAEYLYNMGLYHSITSEEQCKSLLIGDIVFFGTKLRNYARKRFQGIYHCGIVCGTDVDNSDILVLEAIDTDNHKLPIRIAKRKFTEDYITGYCRLPLGKKNIVTNKLNKNVVVNKNEVYNVKLKVVYNDESFNTSFPCIKLNNTIYSQLNSNNTYDFVKDEPMTFYMQVPFIDTIATVTPGQMIAEFTGETNGTIEIEEVIKII
jgi:hypothetical protein